jgi:hypothetical protein
MRRPVGSFPTTAWSTWGCRRSGTCAGCSGSSSGCAWWSWRVGPWSSTWPPVTRPRYARWGRGDITSWSEGGAECGLYLGHGRQPVSWVGEARREVGGAAASRSEHLAAQGVLGGEGDAGEDASGAVCPPYTNAYTYILTRPSLAERFIGRSQAEVRTFRRSLTRSSFTSPSALGPPSPK